MLNTTYCLFTSKVKFALGLTDGGVHVLEPLESEGRWGTSPPIENNVLGQAPLLEQPVQIHPKGGISMCMTPNEDLECISSV
ncbi:hypothetical protein Pyn_17349 [Prunus yedoensis var. nudiflora]|uniref:Uncharacterized protein n=1 Tax=Prunus yedoensis var. nudiflora TaxID=2094558 RepID=A0A314U859_PRUYE|nr:hypothetical protein Pyn_17349 [Prunus yedoensis var. nudiflora]